MGCNWKYHVIIVIKTDLSGLLSQCTQANALGIWLPVLHVPSCIGTTNPSRNGLNELLSIPYVWPFPLFDHTLSISSASPLHCGTASPATNPTTRGSSNIAAGAMSLLAIFVNGVRVVKMAEDRHLPGGRSWVTTDFCNWRLMLSISGFNLLAALSLLPLAEETFMHFKLKYLLQSERVLDL